MTFQPTSEGEVSEWFASYFTCRGKKARCVLSLQVIFSKRGSGTTQKQFPAGGPGSRYWEAAGAVSRRGPTDVSPVGVAHLPPVQAGGPRGSRRQTRRFLPTNVIGCAVRLAEDPRIAHSGAPFTESLVLRWRCRGCLQKPFKMRSSRAWNRSPAGHRAAVPRAITI